MNSGCYQLKIRIKKDITLAVGSLGLCDFEKGEYIYTGSAMKNLNKRVARHRQKYKKPHWHIDYLLAHSDAEISEIIYHLADTKEECKYNQLLINNGAEVPVARFGSSDCKICPAHLVKITADFTFLLPRYSRTRRSSR
jgi:Uri superfamily endonuclease